MIVFVILHSKVQFISPEISEGCSSLVLGSFSDNHAGVLYQALSVTQTRRQKEEKMGNSQSIQTPSTCLSLIPSTWMEDRSRSLGNQIDLIWLSEMLSKMTGSKMIVSSLGFATFILRALGDLLKLSVTQFFHL